MPDQDIQNAVIRHARADMARVPNASQLHPEPEFTGVMDWVRHNHAKQPSFGSQLAAMFREGIKDIRQTIMESYFGKMEHMPEAGTPLNPTQQQVTAEQGNFQGYSNAGQSSMRDAYGYVDLPDTAPSKSEPPAKMDPESHNNLYMTSLTDRIEQARNTPGRDNGQGFSR